MNEVQRSIRKLKNDVTQVDLEVHSLREKQSAFSNNLQEKQLKISQSESSKHELSDQISRMKTQKQIVSLCFFLKLKKGSIKLYGTVNY